MAVAELYTAWQLGVVEGQENPLNTIYSHKFYEVQKYVALTGHMAMNLVLVINEKFYQSLSPELREIFVKSMRDAGDYESEMQIAMNKKNMQDLKDKGMTITVVNKAEFAEKTKDAWKEFEPVFGKASTRNRRAARSLNEYPIGMPRPPLALGSAGGPSVVKYFEEIVVVLRT
jgi:TRAP-type C4-dicarboxylate transport system substrate-binding protein